MPSASSTTSTRWRPSDGLRSPSARCAKLALAARNLRCRRGSRSLHGRLGRQREREAASAALALGERDLAAVRLDQTAADREPEPDASAAAALAELHVGLEHALAVLGRDAG